MTDKNKFIDYTGLSIIGIISLAFAMFYRNIAKLHIDLPFVKAPLFIGEMILAICFFLFFIKWLINRKKVNIFTCLLWFYFGFVIVKTFLGYFYWGPLALRHSVLFCYPLFAVMSYSFYRSSFFAPNKTLFISLLIILIFRFSFHSYYLITSLVLLLIMIKAYPKMTPQLILTVLLIIVFPYSYIFNTSRTFITSNLFVCVYMGIGFLYVSKIKKVYKFIFCLLFISFAFYGLANISNRNEVRSLVVVKEMINRYNAALERFHVREKVFVERKLNVKLYNEETGWGHKISETSPSGEVNQAVVGAASAKAIEVLARQESKKEETPPPKEARQAVTSVVSGRAIEAPAKQETKKEEIAPNKEVRQAVTSVASGRAIEAPAMQESKKGEITTRNKEVRQAVTSVASDRGIETPAKQETKKEETALNKEVGQAVTSAALAKHSLDDRYTVRFFDTPYENSLFRIFIWKDALEELRIKHPIFGFDFGKPFRSHMLEVLRWGEGEWRRDGWVCFHNSYIDIIYRAGIPGILMVASILISTLFLVMYSFRNRSLTGILLTGILMNWFVAANFLEILEMPYSAIPLWSLLGLTFAYLFKNKTL